MFGLAVGGQAHAPARPERGDTFGNGAVFRRRHVRSAHGGAVRGQVSPREVVQPVDVRPCVVVDICDDFTIGRIHAGIPGRSEAAMSGPNKPDGIFPRDRGSFIAGPIVHDDDFTAGIFEPLEAFETVPDRTGPVVSTNNHGYRRPFHVCRKGNSGECRTDRGQRRFRNPIATGKAEIPILDVIPATMPLVRPGKDE